MAIMAWFKAVLVLQLFYAFVITILAHSIAVTMPGAIGQVSAFSSVTDDINLVNVSTEIQGSLESQTNIPVIEIGALVFYSGNILLDLLFNFAFAIPEMLGMLVNGILLLFGNLDSFIWVTVQVFASVLVVVMYVVGLIELLASIRSGRSLT